VLDACDGALQHGATEVEPIAAALLGVLEKEGLDRIDPLGEPFDPTVADAVVHEPGDGGEHIVSQVMRPGYSWQGRVLRPAMVKVTD
jgi:molecular chaperone GrpE